MGDDRTKDQAAQPTSKPDDRKAEVTDIPSRTQDATADQVKGGRQTFDGARHRK